MPQNTDQQQLMKVFGSLLAAKGSDDEPEESSSAAYYRAREDFEKRRFWTSIFAPIIGGAVGNIVSAPFREPLMDFAHTEKGAKLFKNYEIGQNNYNKLMLKKEDIRKSGMTADDFFLDFHLKNRTDQLVKRYGKDWETNPLIANTELGQYAEEAAAAAKLDIGQYYKALDTFKNGWMGQKEFLSKVKKFNPESTSWTQAGTRWLGRLVRKESNEEYTDKMINQITGGPDSPLGIDHQELTKLVNEAIFLDKESLNSFISLSQQTWEENVKPLEVLRATIKLGENQQELAFLTLYKDEKWRAENREMSSVISSLHGQKTPLTWANVNQEVAKRAKLPNLTKPDRDELKTLLITSDEYFNITQKIPEDIKELHPAFSGDKYSTKEQEAFLEEMTNSTYDRIIELSYSLAQKAVIDSEEIREDFNGISKNLQGFFMKALVEQQIPTVLNNFLGTREKGVITKERWWPWSKNIEVLTKFYDGSVTPFYDAEGMMTQITADSEGEKGPEADPTITTGKGPGAEPIIVPPLGEKFQKRIEDHINRGEGVKAADYLVAITSTNIGKALNQPDPDYSDVFRVIDESVENARSTLEGSNMLIVPDLPVTSSYDVPSTPYSIRAWPAGTQAESFPLDDGTIVRVSPGVLPSALGFGTSGQFNIELMIPGRMPGRDVYRLTEGQSYGDADLTRYYYRKGKSPEDTVEFSSIPKNKAIRVNAMFASKVYTDNEQKLIELGVSEKDLKEFNYKQFFLDNDKGLFKNVNKENIKTAYKLYEANTTTLNQFDFSRLPGATDKNRGNVFLRDAYEAYEKEVGDFPREDEIREDEEEASLLGNKATDIIKVIKIVESDHGAVPIFTKDASEKRLLTENRSMDIGFGHKITDEEWRTGNIHGIPFIKLAKGEEGIRGDPSNKYIPLTPENKDTIAVKDVKNSVEFARKISWDKELKARGLNWEDLPIKFKLPLSDLAFNMGGKKKNGKYIIQEWEDIFDEIKNNNEEGFVRELRRQDDGKFTKGMDNRVAIIAYSLGLVNSIEQANDYGLSWATIVNK